MSLELPERAAQLEDGLLCGKYRVLHVSPDKALFIGDGADDELGRARTVGIRACRAPWFLSRWRHATLVRDDPGLWHAADVGRAAIAA
jgi:FMN phosphatase YigB (HAD superfamily)